MTTQTLQMKEVFTRLNDAGFGRRFVKKYALPSWWVDEVAQSPAGLDQTLLIISRRLGLTFEALKTPGAAIQGDHPEVRFKRIGDAPTESLRVPAAIGGKLARLVLRATASTPGAPLPSAEAARAEILGSGAPWVGLQQLLDYSWSHGIPVIHLANLPKTTSGQKVRKPAGMAMRVGDRFAIVLCRGNTSESQQAFWLAHELGHIASGHVESGVLVDEDVDKASEDPQEREANEYALGLMCGKTRTFRAKAGNGNLNAKTVAEESKRLGQKLHIVPGHVALNYAHNMNQAQGGVVYAVVNTALKMLKEIKAIPTLRTKLNAEMSWDELSDDDEEFVRVLTGLDDDE